MAKSKSKSIFVCQTCGAQRPKWEGKCSDCGAWNSFVEEAVHAEPVNARARGWSHSGAQGLSAAPTSNGLGKTFGSSHVMGLDENVEALDVGRDSTGIGELDRVLGGGLVPGSLTLLGGDPGIGKSTLLMQMAGGLAKNNCKVLYISGEESVAQTGLRAQRLGVRSGLVTIGSESNLDLIRDLALNMKPDVMVVDSIQTIFLPDIASAPGSVTQVRESAAHLMGLAKGQGISILLIGHVTKEGQIAGPKVLEHMVDTVLSFEGDISHQFRLLRALKNRFGATHELGVFQMNSLGLVEVSNPSELFLEERGTQLIGSSVFASIEGTRPLLCEVQALATASPMPMPRRTAIGVDTNRIHLLVAVLTKHLQLSLNTCDIFVNVVGGLRLDEPAVDLAIAASLISTELGVEMDPKAVFFGEIGLTGEVRAVSFPELRVKESEKLGFTKFVLPQSNRKHLSELSAKTLKSIVWIRDVGDLFEFLQGASGRVARPVKTQSAQSKPTSKPSTSQSAPRAKQTRDDEMDF